MYIDDDEWFTDVTEIVNFFHLCGCNPMACLHAIYGKADGVLD